MKRFACTLAVAAVVAATFTGIVGAQNAPAGAPGAAAAPGGPGGPGGRGGLGGGAPGGAGGRAGRGGGRGGGRGPAVPPGPPSAVPDLVAIPPMQAELDQINADLKKFVEADNSSMKAALQKYGLVVTAAKPDNPCIRPTAGGVRAPRHDAFVARAGEGPIDILFEGDSITDWWQTAAPQGGKAMLEKYFGNFKLADFAVAGDTTQGVLWGLKNGEGQGNKPKAIMLMIGTNNMGRSTPAQIAEGIGAIVEEDRKDFPDAKILLLAIFPRGLPADANRPKIVECNKIISKLDGYQGHVTYMDIGEKFLDPQTHAFLPETFRGDNLHPVEKGYDIWGTAVAQTLTDWAK